ncbi:hypothetical protein MPH_05599 [Macrophomina phaseolina MS6]|uniref:Uncharacterized protein n=1 Tax=Macrophomina phaseolina (strain MS6) TaxID=1126212 RepID=K2SK14_MACPH|nr:hypothetical protein MPH_05599 [Macrophomina phaseolina MS6]
MLHHSMLTTKWKSVIGGALTTRSTTRCTPERTYDILARASQRKSGMIGIACIASTTTSSILSTTRARARPCAKGRYICTNAYEDMYYLIDKYAPFPDGEGPPRLSADDKVSLSAERDHTVA